MGAAFFAFGETLVDPVTVSLVGDDEDAAVGGCGGGCEDDRAGHKQAEGSHEAPGTERIALIR